MVFIINCISHNKQNLATRLSEDVASDHLLGYLIAEVTYSPHQLCYIPTQIVSQQIYKLLHDQLSGSHETSQIDEHHESYSNHILCNVHNYKVISD